LLIVINSQYIWRKYLQYIVSNIINILRNILLNILLSIEYIASNEKIGGIFLMEITPTKPGNLELREMFFYQVGSPESMMSPGCNENARLCRLCPPDSTKAVVKANGKSGATNYLSHLKTNHCNFLEIFEKAKADNSNCILNLIVVSGTQLRLNFRPTDSKARNYTQWIEWIINGNLQTMIS
jgi:hypothetical protein